MSVFDEVIAAATARLAMDGELRLEVRRELRGHLEDSAGEYEAAGYTPEQAAEEAVKHLGDPGELAEELWRANRGRLRLRAVVKWAAQILLVPAAVVVGVWIAWDSGQTWMAVTQRSLPISWLLEVDSSSNDVQFSRRELAPLTPEQRWVLLGNPKAESELERARSISERWPENLTYFGHYAWRLFDQYTQQRDAKSVDPELRAKLLTVLDRGEKIDPDNGWYTLWQAYVLTEGAVELVEPVSTPETAQTSLDTDTGDNTRPSATTQPWDELYTVKVLRPEDWRQAMEELHRAVRKPSLTDRHFELMRQRLEMLPPARTLMEYWHRLMYPSVNFIAISSQGAMRRLGRFVAGYAVVLAREGRADEAMSLLDDLAAMGCRMTVDTHDVLVLLVGWSIDALATGNRMDIAKLMEDSEQLRVAEERRRAMDELKTLVADFRGEDAFKPAGPWSYQRQAGYLAGISAFGASFSLTPDPGPLRHAEQLMYQGVGLGIGLLSLSLVLAFMGLLAIPMGMRTGRDWRPQLIWIGWHRVCLIVVRGVVAPLALYVLYTCLPVANRDFGINYMPERLAVELCFVGLAMLWLLLNSTRRAIRERATELGMNALRPPSAWWRRLVWGVSAVVVAVVTLYLAAWQVERLRPTDVYHFFAFVEVQTDQPLRWAGRVLAGVLTFAIMGVFLGETTRLARLSWRDRVLGATVLRSMVPVLSAIVILLGVMGHAALSYAQAVTLRSVRDVNSMPVFHEIDGSPYLQGIRQWHTKRLRESPINEHAKVPPGGAGG